MKIFLITISLLFSMIANAEENLNGYCEVEMINNTISFLVGKGVVQPGSTSNHSLPSDTIADQQDYYTDNGGFTVLPYEVTWKGNSGLMPDGFKLKLEFKLDAGKCNLVSLETMQVTKSQETTCKDLEIEATRIDEMRIDNAIGPHSGSDSESLLARRRELETQWENANCN